MRVLNTFVVVENDKERKRLAGGFELSAEETKNHRYQRATVIEASATASAHLSKGDVIWYQKGRDFTLPIDGKERTIIRVEEVVAVED